MSDSPGYLYGDSVNVKTSVLSEETGPWPERPQLECFVHNCYKEALCLEISKSTGCLYPYCQNHIPVPSKKTVSIEELTPQKLIEVVNSVRT